MSEISQEEKEHFDFIRHLHWSMATYVKIRTWEDLMGFENHVDVKLADSGFLPFQEAQELHRKYHESQDERLVKEFQ